MTPLASLRSYVIGFSWAWIREFRIIEKISKVKVKGNILFLIYFPFLIF